MKKKNRFCIIEYSLSFHVIYNFHKFIAHSSVICVAESLLNQSGNMNHLGQFIFVGP